MQPLFLVVDDAIFMRKMLLSILQGAGFIKFVEATNGNEAVEMYVLHRPDIVLLDISMPIKNGLEALTEIIDINPDAKVIMCTAVGKSSSVMAAIEAGAVDFIMKPFDRKKLIGAIGRHVDITENTDANA